MGKVKIIKSNNELINDNIKKLVLTNNDELYDLRQYVLNELDLSGYSEMEIFINVMNWVNSRWEHDGINEAYNSSSLEILKRAESGECFRCVEYGKVTKDILISLGYIARQIGIKSVNFDYGGFGMSHVVTEVWSNELEKWIFLDPQCNCYAVLGDKPLNFYEIYINFDDIEFKSIKKVDKDNYDSYKAFIKNYLGYMNTSYRLNDIEYQLYLHLNGKDELLAFQYMQLSNAVFTKNLEDMYFNPNKTTILFEYKEMIDYKKVAKEHNLNTMEELEKNINLFSAKPNFKLKFLTNTPSFSYYELCIDNKVIILEGDTFEFNLNEGENIISVSSVNKQGIKSKGTKMEILYK